MRRRTSGNLDSWLTWQQGHYRPGMNFGGDSLPRVKRVAQRMGLRDPGAPLILVGGTNGKGSVVAFLEALALAHGLRAGCYTSPWLLRYNESVRVAGRELPDAEIIASFERVEAARRGAAITAFEARALAAAWAIRASEPELAVMEVGLGGRLDAVNVFHAAVAVIASIGLDHCEILGETLEQIAREKAGIMRRGRAAISADPASNRWLRPLAGEAGALFHGAQERYRFGTQPGGWWLRVAGRHLDALPLPSLLGEHQIANAAGAIAAFALAPVPRLELEPQAVAAAMHDVRLRGRLEPLPGPGRRWVDVAHNPGAASALARWLSTSSPPGPLHAVCAMRAGKDLEGTLAALGPQVSCWYVAGLPPPQGAPVQALSAALHRACPGAPATAFDDVESAWRAAASAARSGERVIAFGSFDTARRVLLLESGQGSLDT